MPDEEGGDRLAGRASHVCVALRLMQSVQINSCKVYMFIVLSSCALGAPLPGSGGQPGRVTCLLLHREQHRRREARTRTGMMSVALVTLDHHCVRGQFLPHTWGKKESIALLSGDSVSGKKLKCSRRCARNSQTGCTHKSSRHAQAYSCFVSTSATIFKQDYPQMISIVFEHSAYLDHAEARFSESEPYETVMAEPSLHLHDATGALMLLDSFSYVLPQFF